MTTTHDTPTDTVPDQDAGLDAYYAQPGKTTAAMQWVSDITPWLVNALATRPDQTGRTSR